jgi:hypothetical protein
MASRETLLGIQGSHGIHFHLSLADQMELNTPLKRGFLTLIELTIKLN